MNERAAQAGPPAPAPAPGAEPAPAPARASRPLWKRTWFRGLLALVLVVSFGWLLRMQFKELARLRSAYWPALVAVLGLFLASRYFNGLNLRLALRPLGYAIGRGESFMLVMISTYTNLLLPRAGQGAPAVYLKLRHKVPYPEFGSQLLAVTVANLCSIGLSGLVCVGVMWALEGQRPLPLVAGAFAAALVAGLAPVLVRLPQAQFKNPVLRALGRMHSAWERISSARGILLRIILCNVVVLVLRSLRTQAAFWALGVHVNFWGVYAGSAVADLLFMASLTPGALGFREAALAYSAGMMGTTPELALAATVLDRVVWTLATIVIGQVGIWKLIGPARREAGEGGAAEAPAPGIAEA